MGVWRRPVFRTQYVALLVDAAQGVHRDERVQAGILPEAEDPFHDQGNLRQSGCAVPGECKIRELNRLNPDFLIFFNPNLVCTV